MLTGWGLMWALAFGIYAGCKTLTWVNASVCDAPAWKHIVYLIAWPGLDAVGFLGARARSCCQFVEVGVGVGRMGLGFVLLFGVARLLPTQDPLLVGWTGMIGIVMLLHFGVFQLLSCFWRRVGLDAKPLMNRPFLSSSVSEFWGRRWNTAFRDLAYRFLFRPLTRRFGPRWGLLAGFLFSGAVHDFVISVPARGGYGGPTLYFAIQGLAILAERRASNWRGRAFTAVVVIGPVLLLFHKPFVLRVIVPFMRAIGALP